jgi:hypothetical protein
MVDEFLAFSLMASAAAGLAFGLLGFTVWVLVPVVFAMLLGGIVAVWPLSAALWQKFFYVYGPITSLQFGYLLGGIVACVREAKGLCPEEEDHAVLFSSGRTARRGDPGSRGH